MSKQKAPLGSWRLIRTVSLALSIAALATCCGFAESRSAESGIVADDVMEKHLEATQELIGAIHDADRKDAVKAASFGAYNYVPLRGKPGALTKGLAFKVMSGKLSVLARKPDGEHDFWLVHPLAKLMPSSSFDRLPAQSGPLMRSQSPLVDINNDGKSELIVASRDDSAHGEYGYKVYTIDKAARLYAEIPEADGHPTIFADLNGDGRIEAIRFDLCFQNWYECSGGSPAPLVIMTAGEGGFRFNGPLMKRPQLSESQFKALLKNTMDDFATVADYKDNDSVKAAHPDFIVSSKLWRNMLELIYSGNSRQCWLLLDQAWLPGKKAVLTVDPAFQPGDQQGADLKAKSKEEFLEEFVGQLRNSPYFEDLVKLNAQDSRLLRSNPS